MAAISNTTKGIFASLLASCMFGLVYYYSTLLWPLTGTEIFGWRILLTLPCLTLVMYRIKLAHLIPQLAARIRNKPALLPLVMLSAALIGVQLWLFMWAPINGRAMQVSLGYLLMPLVMVVCGRFLYGEKLFTFQKIAVAFAVIGVSNQAYRLGGISWEVLLVCLGFPAYFVLRRKLRTEHLGGLWFDMLFMLPAALYFIYESQYGLERLSLYPKMWLLLPVLGLLSAVSVGSFIVASKLLPLGLFGLLSYVEPVLLVLVALILGEKIRPDEALTYIAVFMAIAMLAIGGIKHSRPDEPKP